MLDTLSVHNSHLMGPMPWFGEIALGLTAIMVLYWVYGMVCIHHTGRRRTKLIHLVYSQQGDALEVAKREYDAVSFDGHLYRLLTFRSPRKLYGPFIRIYLWDEKN